MEGFQVLGHLSDRIVSEMRNHAKDEYPKEACGVIIERFSTLDYFPCRNINNDPNNNFIIDPRDYSLAEEKGKIVFIVHSHPDASCEPSEADILSCNKLGIPWIIVGYPSEKVRVIRPEDKQVPLLGRPFLHGVFDCYSLIKDYYDQILGIHIPDFDRADNWWEGGENMYLDNYSKAGFIRVMDGSLQEHDGILMQLMASVPNHAAVYVGNQKILHHVFNRLSKYDVYGGFWEKNTWCIVRHEKLC